MTQNPDFDAVAVACALADAARTETLSHFREISTIENKLDGQDYDPVTEGDRGAERAMRAVLAELRPDDAIHGEEYGRKDGTTGWTWVLDPIDGTRAFVAGLPTWTTLIGLVDGQGDAIVGVIDQPILDERYIGSPDGARLDTAGTSQPIHVSETDDLRQAVISTTDPFIMTPPEQGAWTHLRHTARIVRYGLDDAAALIPVVRGAGGLACDWRGNPAKPGGQLVCASHQGVMDQALISLRRSAE